MASALSSARPHSAAIAWATRDAIFVEYPVRDGPPIIVRYHKTTSGLAAALNILIEKAETETRTIARSHPSTKFAPKAQFTDEQRAGVRDVLKKLNIT